MNSQTYFVDLTYTYFAFDDGLDGFGGGGTRFNGHDDQMISIQVGIQQSIPSWKSQTSKKNEEALKALNRRAVLEVKRGDSLQLVASQQQTIQEQLKTELETKDRLLANLQAHSDSLRVADSLRALPPIAQKTPKKGISQSTKRSTESVAKTTSTRQKSGPYFVVLGSFKSTENARRFAEKWAALESNVTQFSYGEYTCVAIGGIEQADEAKRIYDRLKVEHPRVWIHQKAD